MGQQTSLCADGARREPSPQRAVWVKDNAVEETVVRISVARMSDGAGAPTGRSGASDGALRRLLRMGLLVVGVLTAFGVFSAPALAVHTHAFGSQVANVQGAVGLAVDNSGGLTDGNVYVTKTAANPQVVVRLDAAGTELNEIGATAPGGGFQTVWGVAVDDSGGPSNGDVYVADLGDFSGGGSGGVFKFSPTGTYLGTISASATTAGNFAASAVAVERATGDVYVADYANSRVLVFAAGTSTLLRQFPVGGPPQGIAVAPNGNVYITNFSQTLVYDASGAPVGSGILDDQGSLGVAVNHTTGHVTVADGNHVNEFDAAGTKLFDIRKPGVTQWGIGSHDATNRVYVADNGSSVIDRFDPIILADVTADPASAIQPTTVHLSGNVDPDGSTATCSFQYDTDPAFGSPASAPCTPAGPYSSPTAVTADVTGLQPGTLYHFRLRGTTPDGTNDSAVQDFITGAGPPTIGATTSISGRGSTEATVNGSINPRLAATHYWLEYGTDTSYGGTAPASPVDLAATGIDPVAVQVALSRLAPSTTYHYRFVASNSEGTTHGADHTFRTFDAPEQGLPSGRGYELVSPIRKDGNKAGHINGTFNDGTPQYATATDDGSAIVYGLDGSPVGSGDNGFPSHAVSRRGDMGWSTRMMLPQATFQTYQSSLFGLTLSSDLTRAAFVSKGYAPGPTNQGVFISPVGGPGTLVSTPQTSPFYQAPPDAVFPGIDGSVPSFMMAGGSSDLSTIYFAYNGKLLPEDAGRVLPPAPPAPSRQKPGFYRYRDGNLTEAGVLPDGSLDPDGAAPAATNWIGPVTHKFDAELFNNQVSQDGNRAFFVSPDPRSGTARPTELYVRDGDRTLLVSRVAASGAPAPTGAASMPGLQYRGFANHQVLASYVAATRNGRFAVFSSASALTDDAPNNTNEKLYRFDVDAQQLTYLAGIDGSAARVSEDGRRIVVRSPDGSALRLWNAGTVTTMVSGRPGLDGGKVSGVREAAGGRVYVFLSTITPSSIDDPNGQLKVYRYEVGDGSLNCLSCPSDGPVTTDSYVSPSFVADPTCCPYGGQLLGELRGTHVLSADGKHVFFNTAERLSTRDVNGRQDVYEWSDGRPHLITSGRSPYPSFVLDNSVSGDDVFFTTADGLVAGDTDGTYDVYDARVGAVTVAAPGRCRMNCQGDGAGAPVLPDAVTVTFGGPGAGGAPVRSARVVPKVRLLRKTVKGSVLSLTVRASGRGTITVSGSRLVTMRKTVTRAGTYRLRVPLSASGRKALRHRGRLAVPLRVSFDPSSGPSVVARATVTVKA
jgi:hypothetical protein